MPFASMGGPSAPSPYPGGMQPIFYWYPSPPVSPQSTFYLPPCPAAITVKGLPLATQASDILAFLDGLYEVGQRIILNLF